MRRFVLLVLILLIFASRTRSLTRVVTLQYSTEGYAGMVGIASMNCLPHEDDPDLLTCAITPSTAETPPTLIGGSGYRGRVSSGRR